MKRLMNVPGVAAIALLAVSATSWASPPSPTDAPHSTKDPNPAAPGPNAAASAAVVDVLMTPRIYRGSQAQVNHYDPAWYCHERQNFWSMFWQTEVKDVDVQYDPKHPDLTTLHLVMANSELFAQNYTQGGLFCTWNGGEGRIKLGRIDIDVRLKAVATKDFPEFSLDGLQIQDLKLENVHYTAASIITVGFDSMPDSYGRWISGNLNQIIAAFLKTGFKDRLDDAINHEIDRRLKERELRVSHPRIAAAQ